MANQILSEKGIESFLPLYRTRRCWSDRIRELDVPLFPGYLFCRIAGHQRQAVVATTGVVGLVGTGLSPIPVSQSEIEAVMELVRSELPLRPHPFLHVGGRVRMRHGPFAGVEGIVVRADSRSRFVVSITLLQRSVSVEIDPAWIVAVN